MSPQLDFHHVTDNNNDSENHSARFKTAADLEVPGVVLSPGTLGDDVSHQLKTWGRMKFRSYGAEIVSDVALGRRLK